MFILLRGRTIPELRKMKVLAFNGSPRRSRGTTDMLMEAFIDGAKRSEAEIEKHHVIDLNINGCLSCFSCWWKTPGKCVHRDDMDWILPKIPEADILLLGTPIYGRNVTHYLQRLVERTFSFSLPEMQVEDGVTTHPARIRRFPQLVLCATCGFPDLGNFDIVRALYPQAIHILLPAAQMLFNEEGREFLADFLDNIKLTGRKMAVGKEIPALLRESLVVDFSDEMKGEIIKAHNLYSSSQQE